ncbi:Protease inhibitor/seed storage/lipid transfer family protein, partial [Melia azedarach]
KVFSSLRIKKKKMSSKICVVILIIVGLFASDKQVSGQFCGFDVAGLKTQCLKFVGKSGPPETPSKDCCEVVRKIDVKCGCDFLTEDIVRELSKEISIEKAEFVAKSCGLKLPPGTKCAGLKF